MAERATAHKLLSADRLLTYRLGHALVAHRRLNVSAGDIQCVVQSGFRRLLGRAGIAKALCKQRP